MSEAIPLDEALQLELRGQPFRGETPVPVTRPTLAGLQWLAVPTDCVGLAYRIQGGKTLEAIGFEPDPQVKLSLEISAPVVNLACSPDGRLVVAACIDGSLQCFNATSKSFQIRWILENVHSHIVSDVADVVSTCREAAASEAGPIRAMSFTPTGYGLLMVDAGNEKLSIYDAASSAPVDLFQNDSTTEALCAAWSTETSSNGEYPFAVGVIDGSIQIKSISLQTGHTTDLSSIPSLDEEDEDKIGFVCTQLDWFNNGRSLASGYCRVTPSEDDEDDDEDDSAEHEATLYVGTMDQYRYLNRTELGDVVSFFSVPKHGRHVFFTSFVPSNNDTPLLLVASNVSNDIGVVASIDDKWQVLDLQEGCNATTPTDDDDEYTFPTGIATILLPEGTLSSQALLVTSTDGSLCAFQVLSQNDADAFRLSQTSTAHGTVALPATPLEPVLQSPPTPPLSSEPEETVTKEGATQPTPAFGSGSASGFSFGSTKPPAFGSPVFGQPSKLGASGTPKSAAFGSTSSSTFGSPAATAAPFGSSGDTLAFGSGSKAPVFGFGSPSTGGFAAIAASSSSGFSSMQSPQSPFGAFRTPDSSMVKPLFGGGEIKVGAGSGKPEKAQEMARPTVAETAKTPDQLVHTPAKVSTEGKADLPGAKEAARVFDSFDEGKTGVVPIDMFEDMLDELGEGFHGDELDAQMARIDPEGSGQVGRTAFVAWYVELLSGGGGSGDDDGGSEDSEREEERAKAEAAFSSMATTGEGSQSAMAKADFGKLMEAMGTTYCEEEHRKTVKKLSKSDGMIYRKDFVDWYLNWLFGEEDEESEDESSDDGSNGDGEDAGVETAQAGAASGAGSSSATVGGWGSMFTVSEDTWKCSVCMVQNPESAKVCVACETKRPGQADAGDGVSAPADSSNASRSSIGPGGFRFGGGSLSSTSGSVFGSSAAGTGAAAAESSNASRSSIGAGGFRFGGGSVSSTSGSGFVASPAPAAFGSSSVGKLDSSVSQAGSGLSSGVPEADGKASASSSASKPSASPAYPPMSTKPPVAFGAGKTSKASASSGYPPMSTKPPGAFGASKTSKPSASPAYPPMSTKPPGAFGASKTSKPSASPAYPPMSTKPPDAFGASKSSTSVTTKSIFAWADPPKSSKATSPFGGGNANATAFITKPATSSAVSNSTSSLFPSALPDGRKSTFGSSDDMPAFGSGSKAPVFGFGSPSTGGFAAIAASSSSGFSSMQSPQSPFGAFRTPDSSMVKPLFGGGEIKVGAGSGKPEKAQEMARPTVAETAKTPDQLVPTPAKVSTEGKADLPGAKEAARVFDSFDEGKTGVVPIDMFEDMLDELGEGFHGDELDAQMARIDPEGTGQVGRTAFVAWYVELLSGGGGSGDDDGGSEDSEREEERAKAEAAFSSMTTTGEGSQSAMAKADFGKLMEAMGTTYCEEEHRKTVKKLSKSDGMIYRKDFVDWYLNWLFGEEDEESEDESSDDGSNGDGEDAGVVTAQAGTASGAVSSSATVGGWGSMFTVSEDTWKCSVCMVQNPESAKVCVACETKRPGQADAGDGVSAPADSSNASRSSIGPGGFRFGGGSLSSTSGSVFGSSAAGTGAAAAESSNASRSSIGAGGFRFGGGSVSSTSGSGFVASPTPAAFGSSSVGKLESSVSQAGSGLSSGVPEADGKASASSSASKPSASPAYPPMSTKPPVAFGAGKTSKASASSGYPPMSTKPPGAFGASKTSKPSASPAYPPMSTKPPGAFGASKTSKPSASPAYPPMSMKPPVAFVGANKTSKPTVSTAYPPMSTKPPDAFGASKTSKPVHHLHIRPCRRNLQVRLGRARRRNRVHQLHIHPCRRNLQMRSGRARRRNPVRHLHIRPRQQKLQFRSGPISRAFNLQLGVQLLLDLLRVDQRRRL